MEIIKPKIDTRKFKYVILENNIKCIFINDKTLEKSYMVANVNVGSFANKYYYDGMAHLLEHMCFISNNKYKEINYLSNQVSKSGGSTNAYTQELSTIYYLDIFTKNFEELLDIFINCIFNAELNKDYISKEINNVDAEHKKNINNDNWKLFNLEKILANQDNHYNGFYTGKKETLHKKDIYKKMTDFYNKFYNSNNVTFCFGSNLEINKQYEIVSKILNQIPTSKITNTVKLNKPIYNNNYGKTFYIKTSNIKSLKYIFECPAFDKKNNLFMLLSYVINSSEDNLLIYYLKLKGLIYDLHSNYNDFGIFTINMTLSDLGFKNVFLVDSFIQYSINKILNFDWEKIYKYYKKINEYKFNTLKLETLDLCIRLTENLLYYDPNEIYKGPFIYYDFNNKHLNIMKKSINFDNSIRIISGNVFKYKKYKTDVNYKAKYLEIKFVSELTNFSESLCFDFDNKYIKTKPTFYKNLTTNIPIEISNNFWFGNTSKFNEPYITCDLIYYNSKYFNTPLNMLLTGVSVNIINEILSNKLHKAEQFNFECYLYTSIKHNSITLSFEMVNDTKIIQEYVNQVFHIISNEINITEEYFKQKINAYHTGLHDTKYFNPWDFTDYIFKSGFNNFYFYTKQMDLLKTIKIDQIKNTITNLFTGSNINLFIYGNITQTDIPKFNIKSTNTKLTFPKYNIKNTSIKHPNPKEKSNCVKVSYFTGKFDPLRFLHILFIGQICQPLFFRELRTEKLLGYLVQMFYNKINKNYYIYQQIQSEKSCKEIIKHINEFNKTLINKVRNEDINKWKETIIKHLTKKDDNLSDSTNRYSSQIHEQMFIFNINEIVLEQIDKVTKESIVNFINKYIINNENKSITQVYV